MKIQIIITLEPDGGPAETVTFEQHNQRKLNQRDRSTSDEAVLAKNALTKLAADARKWAGSR